MLTRNNIGKVLLPLDLVRENPGVIARVLYGAVPMYTETNLLRKTVEYAILHPTMTSVPQARIVPTYVVTLSALGAAVFTPADAGNVSFVERNFYSDSGINLGHYRRPREEG